MKTVSWEKFEKELLKDPRVAREIARLEPEYQLARSLIAARIKKKLTQTQLAKRAKTNQASISRLEGASARPSFSFLTKVANALDARLTIRFDL